MTRDRTRGEFTRYVLVGLGSNGLLYLAYLALTAAGMRPKPAMSLLYVAGTLQTFLFNKHWSFRSGGAHRTELARYLASYAFGYLLNLLALWFAVDRGGLPHQEVQGVMIVTLAVLLFLLQKYWVFRAPRAPATGAPP